MRIPDAVRNSVVYIYEQDVLLGTGFAVGVEDEDDPELVLVYIVTARHIVEGRRGLSVRLNDRSQSAVSVPITDDVWWPSLDPHADVAAGLFGYDVAEFSLTVVPTTLVADAPFFASNDVGPGDQVAFVGLFQGSPGVDRNLPIARFGQICRMADEVVETQDGGGTHWIEAIMVEAHSWGGHSGSPAFVLFEATRHPGFLELPELPLKDQKSIWALLGVVSGHWELPADVRRKNEPNVIADEHVMVNAGIALVTPGQKVLDLLQGAELVADRARLRAAAIQVP